MDFIVGLPDIVHFIVEMMTDMLFRRSMYIIIEVTDRFT